MLSGRILRSDICLDHTRLQRVQMSDQYISSDNENDDDDDNVDDVDDGDDGDDDDDNVCVRVRACLVRACVRVHVCV